MIVEDTNGKNQLLSFAIINNRTKESFVLYFEQLAELIPDVKTFVTDRNTAQVNAIEAVWPEAKIIYCQVHIGRNIRDKVGEQMYKLYQQMIRKKASEEDLICAFENEIKNNKKVSKFLTKLLSISERWLPSHVNKIEHRGNVTTNRVEGFFGVLKRETDHCLKFMSQLSMILLNEGDKLYVHSRSMQKDIKVMDLFGEDGLYVGYEARKQIVNEYKETFDCLVERYSSQYSKDCCYIHQCYDLPCRHLLALRICDGVKPLLSLQDIPLRWQDKKDSLPISHAILVVESITKNKLQPQGWSFSNCQAKFEEAFQQAQKLPYVQDLLDFTLHVLDDCKVSSNPKELVKSIIDSHPANIQQTDSDHTNPLNAAPPNALQAAGAPFTHPLYNVDHRITKKHNKKKNNDL